MKEDKSVTAGEVNPVMAEANWQHVKDGMVWIDSGEHKIKTEFHIES